jgi:hypothetical protein
MGKAPKRLPSWPAKDKRFAAKTPSAAGLKVRWGLAPKLLAKRFGRLAKRVGQGWLDSANPATMAKFASGASAALAIGGARPRTREMAAAKGRARLKKIKKRKKSSKKSQRF